MLAPQHKTVAQEHASHCNKTTSTVVPVEEFVPQEKPAVREPVLTFKVSPSTAVHVEFNAKMGSGVVAVNACPSATSLTVEPVTNRVRSSRPVLLVDVSTVAPNKNVPPDNVAGTATA